MQECGNASALEISRVDYLQKSVVRGQKTETTDG